MTSYSVDKAPFQIEGVKLLTEYHLRFKLDLELAEVAQKNVGSKNVPARDNMLAKIAYNAIPQIEEIFQHPSMYTWDLTEFWSELAEGRRFVFFYGAIVSIPPNLSKRQDSLSVSDANRRYVWSLCDKLRDELLKRNYFLISSIDTSGPPRAIGAMGLEP